VVGHQIPAWYDKDGDVIVAKSDIDAYIQYFDKLGKTEWSNTLKEWLQLRVENPTIALSN